MHNIRLNCRCHHNCEQTDTTFQFSYCVCALLVVSELLIEVKYDYCLPLLIRCLDKVDLSPPCCWRTVLQVHLFAFIPQLGYGASASEITQRRLRATDGSASVEKLTPGAEYWFTLRSFRGQETSEPASRHVLMRKDLFRGLHPLLKKMVELGVHTAGSWLTC